jgi:formylglycine-generating enzyme required for sulfatase activity
MLTCKDALEGDDLVQLGFATSNPDKRPSPRRRGAKIPDALEAVFIKALAVEPENRYASAGEFLEAAVAAVEGTELAVRPPAVSDPMLRSPESAPRSGEALPAPPSSAQPRATVVAATLKAAPEVRGKRGGGVITTLLALLVVAASVTAVFAASDLDGARETRAVLLNAYHKLRGDPVAVSTSDQVGPGSFEDTGALATAPSPGAAGACPDKAVFIAAGKFERTLPERSAEVRLGAFCIDQSEVTAADYAACVQDGACPKPTNKVSWPRIKHRQAKTYPALCTYGNPKLAQHPINCVDWDMAEAYCKAKKERLPTEAEWEYAALGAAATRYPWGNDDPTSQHLNACDQSCRTWSKKNGTPLGALLATDDGHAQTAPVKSYEEGKTPAGVYDLSGNVREWVADYFGDYPDKDQTNPTGPETGKLRVVRGGGWDSADVSEVTARAREGENPHALHPSLGFRCAASPTQ